jgi:peroxiredoxin
MSAARLLKNPVVIVPVFVGVLAPCVIFLVVFLSHRSNSQAQLDLKDAVFISGQTLPQTDLLEIDGRRASPDLLRNGRVLLVFLTTDCKPCQQEWELLSQVEPEISDRVKIRGVGIESQQRLLDFIQAHGIKTHVLLDKDGKLMYALNVKYFPAKYLLVDGTIVKTWFGNSPDRETLFKELGL